MFVLANWALPFFVNKRIAAFYDIFVKVWLIHSSNVGKTNED